MMIYTQETDTPAKHTSTIFVYVVLFEFTLV